MALSPKMQAATEALQSIIDNVGGHEAMAVVNQALGVGRAGSIARMAAGAILCALAVQGQMVSRGATEDDESLRQQRHRTLALLRATADLLQTTLE